MTAREIAEDLGGHKSGGEWIAFCPAHDDKNTPSLSLSEGSDGKLLWHCHAGCSQDAVRDALIARGLYKSSPSSVRSTPADSRTQVKPAPIPEVVVRQLQKSLTSEMREYLAKDRVLPEKVLSFYRLGQRGERLAIPIYDRNGHVVNIRLHLPVHLRKENDQKMISWEMGRGEGRLFPIGELKHQELLLCEGELDALAAISHGIPAITATSGATAWKDEHSKEFAGKKITILMDHDEAGEKGALIRAKSLSDHGVATLVARFPSDRPKGHDVTDEIRLHGVEGLEQILEQAKPYVPKNGLVCLKDVKAEEVHWLWKPFIPIGKVTLIEGDPGLGKSWATLSIASALSSGTPLPESNPMAPKRVLLLSAEDGLADTIKPRLDALGGSAANIFAPAELFTFDEAGLSKLDALLTTLQPRLVVIDPLVAYLGGKMDMNKANQTRQVMAGLAEIASRQGCAIVCVRHLRKGQDDKAIYRGMGSIDFTAACRSVLLVGCDSDDRSKRAMIQIKCNLHELGGAVGYSIHDGGFQWTGKSDLTPERVLGPSMSGLGTSALGEATTFLEDALAHGMTPSNTLFTEAEARGISHKTLYRAKKALTIRATKVGDTWHWAMPQSPTSNQLGQDAHVEKLATLNG